MIKQASLRGLETVINRTLRLDPDTLKKLSTLSGKVIAIEIKGLNLRLYIRPCNKGIQLLANYEGTVHTTIHSTPFGLLGLAHNVLKKKSMFNMRNTTIEGDIELGQTIQAILQELDLDWEEELSKLIGDVAAHQVGKTVRGTSHWLHQTKMSIGRNITEYIQEEIQLQPTRLELKAFYEDITELRDAVARLEARIKLYLAY